MAHLDIDLYDPCNPIKVCVSMLFHSALPACAFASTLLRGLDEVDWPCKALFLSSYNDKRKDHWGKAAAFAIRT